MKIDVIGGYGVIGREMQTRKFMTGHNVTYYNRQALDIMTDLDKIRQLDSDLIINLAVDKNPKNVYENVNSIGVRNIRDNTSIKMLYLSTDYVFDGRRGYYSRYDSTSPVNNYGESKLLGERELFGHDTIIRTSWVMSKSGGFYKKIAEKMQTQSKIEVVCNRYGSPTAAHLLLEFMEFIVKSENHVNLMHYSNIGTASWYDVALEIAKIENYHGKIVPVAYEDIEQDMPRPFDTSLKSTTEFRNTYWRMALWEL